MKAINTVRRSMKERTKLIHVKQSFTIDITGVIEDKLKDLLEGFETIIKSSIDSAINNNIKIIKTQKFNPSLSQENILTIEEDKIESKVSSIQEICEKLQNKLIEKEKKLLLLQQENSRNSALKD